MSTLTPRLGLTLPDGPESWSLDVWNNNMTILDGASANAKEVTSLTRPATPDVGDIIVETDTDKVQIYLAGQWRHIGSSSGGITVDSGKQINVGASNAAAPITVRSAAAGGQALAFRVASETISRLFVNTNGKFDWSDGTNLTDVNLQRFSAGVLAVGGALRSNGWQDANGAVTVSQTENTAGTATSTTYVETLTGGTPCAFTFVAPASGKVKVYNSAFVDNSTTARSYLSFIIRAGGTIGSGTTILSGDDEKALTSLGADDLTATRVVLVSGLTPGNTYNIRQTYKVSTASTASYQWKELMVEPLMF